jgi:hypothetical protein
VTLLLRTWYSNFAWWSVDVETRNKPNLMWVDLLFSFSVVGTVDGSSNFVHQVPQAFDFRQNLYICLSYFLHLKYVLHAVFEGLKFRFSHPLFIMQQYPYRF